MILDPPRWKSGPPVCASTNRLGFETQQAFTAWLAKNAPRVRTYAIYRCEVCGLVHADTGEAAPSGESSGTARPRKRKQGDH